MRTMVARVSIDDVIIYANEALAAYLKTPKRSLMGSTLEDVRGSLAARFPVLRTSPIRSHQQPSGQRRRRKNLRGPGVFQRRVLDIILDEIGALGQVTSELRESSGTPLNCSARRNCEQSAILSGDILVSPTRGFADCRSSRSASTPSR